MEYLLLILSFLIFFIFSLKHLVGRWKCKFNLPPTPAWSLPVIGHLHLLKPPLHQILHSLSQSLGGAPIFRLRLGNRVAFVVSSLSLAEECFTKNDIVLADRPKFTFGRLVEYNCTTMATTSYGDHWRNLRRIGAIEIFSSHRLDSFLSIRKDEIRHLILCLSKNSLHVREVLYTCIYIFILRFIVFFSKLSCNLDLCTFTLVYVQNLLLAMLSIY